MARATSTTKTTTGRPRAGRTIRQHSGSGSAPFPASITAAYGFAIGGPIIPKEVLGGKTYFFVNYEGFSFPQSVTIHRDVPSPSLRNGIITDPVTGTPYNLATHRSAWSRAQSVGFKQSGTRTSRRRMAAAFNPLCDGTNVLGFAGNIGSDHQQIRSCAARPRFFDPSGISMRPIISSNCHGTPPLIRLTSVVSSPATRRARQLPCPRIRRKPGCGPWA